MLRRIESAGYEIAKAVSIEQIEAVAEQGIEALDKLLLPSEDALPSWPRITIDDQQVSALRHGQTTQVSEDYKSAKIRLFDQHNTFLGLGEMTETGTVSPKRVFVVEETS